MKVKAFAASLAAAVMGFAGGAAAQSADDIVANAPAAAWRALDPENTLYLDIDSGRIVIELRPDFAPGHVQQLKTLARQQFYDGIVFHRVIEGFVAQAGDPLGTGEGGSTLPDLNAEFTLMAGDGLPIIELGEGLRADQVGFVDGLPVGAVHDLTRVVRADGRREVWGLHCPGVMSMARVGAPPNATPAQREAAFNSANSQFFLVLDERSRSLDRDYTVWGRIVYGFDASDAIARGEPPALPTAIRSIRVAADVPPADRTNVEVMQTNSTTFRQYVDALNAVDNGVVNNICDVPVPSRLAQN